MTITYDITPQYTWNAGSANGTPAAPNAVAGDILVALVALDWDVAGCHVTGITDNYGNTWQRLGYSVNATGDRSQVEIWATEINSTQTGIALSIASVNAWSSGNTGMATIINVHNADPIANWPAVVIGYGTKSSAPTTLTVTPVAAGSFVVYILTSGEEADTTPTYPAGVTGIHYATGIGISHGSSRRTVLTPDTSPVTIGMAESYNYPRMAAIAIPPLVVSGPDPAFTVWNGVSEVPVAKTIWNGTSELALSSTFKTA